MSEKSYRAERHDIIRAKQRENHPECHHPDEKQEQITRVLSKVKRKKPLLIMELFAGHGNLSSHYQKYTHRRVERYDKLLKTGDSYLLFHKLIWERNLYDVIDIDSYGFPNRFFPDIFLLIKDGYLFLTMPKPYVNIMNGMTQQQLTCYYGEANPSLETIIEKIQNYSLCHWRTAELIDQVDLGRLWRLCFRVKRVKATEYCGVKNR